nr:glycosyltransferase [Pedobacter jejuensis]
MCEELTQLQESKINSKYQIKVLTTTANGKTELNVKPGQQQFIDGVSVTYFKRLTKDHSHFSPALLLNLRREILNSSNDNILVHIHAWWNLTSIFSCFIAKWYNIPIVLSPRGMLTSYTFNNRNSFSKHIIHAILGKRLLKYCHIHTTSKKEKEDVLKIVEPKKIIVIPNLVNIQAHKVNANEHSSTFKIIFLSRIEEKKGLELLFEALASLSFSWSLTIAGYGEKDYVQKLSEKAQKLNITENITWVGQVSNEQKFDLLAAHDVFALTSYNENFANVVVESLSVGTAVLISNKVGLSDYIIDNNFGWIADLDAESITQKINEAYENIDLRHQVRQKSPITIANDFEPRYLASSYLKLYNSLISNGN